MLIISLFVDFVDSVNDVYDILNSNVFVGTNHDGSFQLICQSNENLLL